MRTVFVLPKYIELYTNLPLSEMAPLAVLYRQDSQLGPNGVHYREVSLYMTHVRQLFINTDNHL